MLVKERMSHPVITVVPDMPIMDALNLMKSERIRRLPVVEQERTMAGDRAGLVGGRGALVGIISDKDLLNAAPSDATSLSIWELNHLISKIRVQDIMTQKVLTVTEDTPIEEAAYLMVENKIGGLPVMRNGALVGLITETDLFKIFLELLGAREAGVRVTALVPDRVGELEELTHAIAAAGGSFIAFGQFAGESQTNRMVTFKVKGLNEAAVQKQIAAHIERLVDIRTTHAGHS